MKIAIIGSPSQKNNKDSTGGVEILNYSLSQGLKKRGHKVTLFADFSHHELREKEWQKISETRRERLGIFCHYLEFMEFLKQQERFDIVIISVYSFYFFAPLLRFLKIPYLIIIHGPCLGEKLFSKFVLEKFSNLNLINVSHFMKNDFTKNYPSKVIYNGVDVDQFNFQKKSGRKILWLGRVVKNKGLKEAIEIAKKARINLDIFGPLRDKEYFENEIKPILNSKIKYRGEADHKTKNKFYGQARALLAPIQWDEPFGLVFIEAMACGTPVIAFRKGAVPEVIVDGKTGFICPPNDFQCMVKAVKKIAAMPEKEYLQMRKNCREHVEKHFSLERMVDDYERTMQRVINDW